MLPFCATGHATVISDTLSHPDYDPFGGIGTDPELIGFGVRMDSHHQLEESK